MRLLVYMWKANWRKNSYSCSYFILILIQIGVLLSIIFSPSMLFWWIKSKHEPSSQCSQQTSSNMTMAFCHKINVLRCLARRPLCHKINVPSWPLCYKMNLPRCSAQRPLCHEIYYSSTAIAHSIMICDFDTFQLQTCNNEIFHYDLMPCKKVIIAILRIIKSGIL